MPSGMEDKGSGGAITVRIACSGCQNSLHYANSMVCLAKGGATVCLLPWACAFLFGGMDTLFIIKF